MGRGWSNPPPAFLALRPVSTLQWKIFWSNQNNFLTGQKCFTMNGNQPLDWLRDVWFMVGLQNHFHKNKQKKNRRSAGREKAWQHSEWEEDATKHRAEKKDEHSGSFKLFLHRVINIMPEFSCTLNPVCVDVTYTVVTVHAICEGLLNNHYDNLVVNFSLKFFHEAYADWSAYCSIFFSNFGFSGKYFASLLIFVLDVVFRTFL